jgi:hypothetical protein
VTLMLTAINRDLPLETAMVRREVDLGRALRDEEIEEEIKAFQAASQKAAWLRLSSPVRSFRRDARRCLSTRKSVA